MACLLADSDFNQDPFIESLDLFYATENIDRFSAIFEIVAERSYLYAEVDIERLSFKYEFTPRFAVAIGRQHTPLGYWNTTMHHGRLLHDSVERPFFMEFDHDPQAASVLPVHMVGFVTNGDFEFKKLILSYQFHISNAQVIFTLSDYSGHSYCTASIKMNAVS